LFTLIDFAGIRDVGGGAEVGIAPVYLCEQQRTI
jgi:hypothetical protein